MPCTLRYGIASQLTLPLESEGLAGCRLGEVRAPLDVRRAVLDALAAPLEYPQLTQAVVSGDHVTVVVDRLVPRGADAAAAVVEYLQESGIGPESIALVFTTAAEAESARLLMKQTAGTAVGSSTRVDIEVHDSNDRGKLSFLTNTPSGKPIYVNRAIGEADFVILVGSPRGAVSWSFRGPYGGIYPTFSDKDAQNRFRNAALLHRDSETFVKSQDEVESIGWRAGAQFVVEIVPGAGDEAAAVVAGELTAAARCGAALRDAEHRYVVPKRVRTVIASLTGRAAQTWEQFACALGAALEVVEDGGVVAMCTDLEEPLGPAMELLSKVEDDRDEALAHLRKERPIDLFIALQLAEAQRRVRFHLLSKLDDETVEALSMTPIGDPADIGRLAARGGSCLVVADAQHAVLIGPEAATK
jgi:nickel-dependent lactate racemase